MSKLPADSFLAAWPLRRLIPVGAVLLVLFLAIQTVFFFNRPVAEVSAARRGKAVSAVYGTVKIEWSFTSPVRAQNTGFIQFAEGIFAGKSSVGIRVKKGQLLATIVDENTSRQIRQARIDLQAAIDRQRIGPASAQQLVNAEDQLARLAKLQELDNVPAAQLQQARSEVARLKSVVESERIELERVVQNLSQGMNSLQERLGKTEIKSPIDGVLTAIHNADGELVFENNVVFNVAQEQTYVNGEVNEEDVGHLREGMPASIRLYSYPNREFTAQLSSILPGGDPNTRRYTVILNLQNPPANIMAGMTGEMNIILGERANAILIPTRALTFDKVWVVEGSRVVPRTVKSGFRTLEFTEILEGVAEGEKVIVADQDLFHPGQRVRPLLVNP